MREVLVGDGKLEVIPEFCYLRDRLSDGDQLRAACGHILQVYVGLVLPTSTTSPPPQLSLLIRVQAPRL